MRKIKSLTVIGTRPEAIKMAIFIKELDKADFISNKLCLTGQHRDMLDQVLEFFSIKGDYDLDIMEKNQNLESITTKILMGLSKILKEFKPDLIFVHGDTTTCFASSLAAFYQGIKVCHIEAGLRTNNINRPFPEELNRNLVSKIAFLNFAPTEKNKQSLLKENIDEEKIFVTGNTVIDSLLWTVENNISFSTGVSKKIQNCIELKYKIILITAHRRENIGKGLNQICDGILKILSKIDDIIFIFSVHPNPKVKNTIFTKLGKQQRVILSEPLSYPDFVLLIKNSWLILTDSGGLQEEAPSLGVPVLVLREETERKEAISTGVVELIGTNPEKISKKVENLYFNSDYYHSMANAINPYGDGTSVYRIIKIIKDKYSEIIE
jgi:UDP-N-acetylglucosamine 2-epimerase (non-hydrolysing)